MLTLLAAMAMTHQGTSQSASNVDAGLPPDEKTLMEEVMSDYPSYSGTAYLIDDNGNAHCNRIGGLNNLIRYQPVPDQPGIYTDGEESFAMPNSATVE